MTHTLNDQQKFGGPSAPMPMLSYQGAAHGRIQYPLQIKPKVSWQSEVKQSWQRKPMQAMILYIAK